MYYSVKLRRSIQYYHITVGVVKLIFPPEGGCSRSSVHPTQKLTWRMLKKNCWPMNDQNPMGLGLQRNTSQTQTQKKKKKITKFRPSCGKEARFPDKKRMSAKKFLPRYRSSCPQLRTLLGKKKSFPKSATPENKTYRNLVLYY